MALPEQIRRQTEAANAHFANLENPEGSTEAGAEQSVVDAVESVAATAESGAEVANESTTTEQVVTEDPNSETYAQRYRTLQGIYNAEVPRLQTATREQTARIQQLEQLLASMSSTPTPTPRQEEAPRLVSDTERAEYGDSIEVMRKVSREEVSAVTSRLGQIERMIEQLVGSQNTIVPQVQRVAQQQHMSAQDRFWQTLEQRVPNWQQVNNDQDFHTWLLDIDPLTGSTRQSYLQAAQESLDAGRVAAFFKTFSEITGKYKPDAAAQPTRSTQATELERQVSPGRPRSAATPSGQVSRTYTRADIQKFFDDVRSGKYKGQEAERNRIERDIFSAQAGGRIVA